MSTLVQLLVMGYGSGAPTSGDADVQDWIDRVYAAGGTISAGTLSAVETFVSSAKSNSYFTAFRRLNLFAGTGVAYLHPLVNTSGSAADTSSGAGVTYAESTGAVTDGASYVDTGYNPGTANTGGLSIYLRTAVTSEAVVRVALGMRDGVINESFRVGLNQGAAGGATAGAAWGRWGGNSSSLAAGSDTPAGGLAAALWHVNRESGTSLKLYRSGTQVGATATTSVGTVDDPSLTVYVFAFNAAGTAANHLEANTASGGYAIHDAFTDAQAANYYTDLHAFNTALGRNF